MSKRVKIAVVREATLNGKPTDTHYLAEGGLKISRRDALALKGTTLYYEVLVDLGEVKGFDFIPGRDVPVYLTDSDSVLALRPQSLSLVDAKDQLAGITVHHVMHSGGATVDTTLIPQNATVEPIDAISNVVLPVIPASAIVDGTPVIEVPVKRRPGRPRKVAAEVIVQPVESAVATLDPVVPEEKVEAIPVVQVESDFVVAENQDDESTFLIDPDGASPEPKVKTEFVFEPDEDELLPPPPPARNSIPQNVDFEVEDEDESTAPESAPVAVPVKKTETRVEAASTTDDFTDVEPGLFDE